MNAKFPWASPLSSAQVAGAQSARRELQVFSDEHFLLERRPYQGGRTALLKVQDDVLIELLPESYSVRSRVHEYGGGAYLACEHAIYFVEESNQQIYTLNPDGSINQISHQDNARFGDLCMHQLSGALICVRETHHSGRVANELVCVAIDSGEITVLANGDDFYASPCLSPEGDALSYVSWNHPDMPWHHTRLWRASMGEHGACSDVVQVLPGVVSSKAQPRWGSGGELYFLDDVSGWWNLWMQAPNGADCIAVCSVDADLGRAQWELGASSYQLLPDGGIYAIATKHGRDRLLHLPHGSTSWSVVAVAQSQMSWLCATVQGCSYIGASSDSSLGVYCHGRLGDRAVVSSQPVPIASNYLSVAESFVFETVGGLEAQGFFYAPKNPDTRGDGGLPPLIVVMHGGPTSACSDSFNSLVQFWTTRGLAVFDINYRGSTGFGRQYRLALQHAWGVADVQDCERGVKALIAAGKVDPARVAIRGGSAGGFTALAAAAGSDVFAVVGCHYGVADLNLLARDTHKFESRYLDHLIGAYPAEQQRYRERSPIHQLERIKCPVFISHGELDHVVPVNQAHVMAQALQTRGQEVELLLFDDERHGYTRQQNIAALLERELNFYVRVFGTC